MKKKLIKRTVKLVSFLLLVVISVLLLQGFVLCHYDHNRLRLDGYYLEDKGSIDVVMVGASEVYAGFAPGLAYEKFGFTSYPYATASATAGAAMTQLKEVLRTQNPKLIVIEINAFLYGDDKNENKQSSIRNYIDNVPLNENKIEYIQKTATEDEVEYYIPFIKYHSTWSDYPGGIKYLGANIQQHLRGYNYLKGYKTKTHIFTADKKLLNATLATDESRKNLCEDSEKKLRELLDFCKSNQMENVVFIRSPHLVYGGVYNRFCRGNTAGDIIKSYGYDYINFERDANTLSYEPNDYYNYDHLNLYGSAKFTEYFGQMLVDRYHIGQSSLTENQQKNWDDAVKFYHKFYRYCDDFMKTSDDFVTLEEDLTTLKKLENY